MNYLASNKRQENLTRQISRLTYSIENLVKEQSNEETHPELADLYFERAELYFKTQNFQWAIEDYTACLDFNPYFYEADMGREMVYLAMEEGVEALAA